MLTNGDAIKGTGCDASGQVVFPLALSQVLASDALQTLIEEGRCSRRISPEGRFNPTLSDLVQPIDIHLGLSGDSTRQLPNMDGYPQRSLSNAMNYMDGLRDRGIRKMLDDDKVINSANPLGVLQRHGAAIAEIRERFPKNSMEITVDPFNEALNTNGTWGVVRDGKLDFELSATLLVNLADVYAAAGCDYLLTLGRMEHEVSLVSKAIDLGKYDTKVASFSTNVETTNAYAYLPDSVAGRNTGQKILNGNIHEMLLRAIVDIHQGSRYVIVKPAENTYLISELARLLGDGSHLENFLNDPNVIGLSRGSAATGRVIQEVRDDIGAFAEKARDVQLGTYTVSGTYFSDTQLLARKGPGFTREVLEERFANILASGYAHSGRVNVIDRNASWFAGQTVSSEGVH
jgi:porphobilinogen synthase